MTTLCWGDQNNGEQQAKADEVGQHTAVNGHQRRDSEKYLLGGPQQAEEPALDGRTQKNNADEGGEGGVGDFRSGAFHEQRRAVDEHEGNDKCRQAQFESLSLIHIWCAVFSSATACSAISRIFMAYSSHRDSETDLMSTCTVVSLAMLLTEVPP